LKNGMSGWARGALIVCIFLFVWVGWAWLINGKGWLQGNDIRREQQYLRLHVIAHSNAPVDQEVKLKVRDAVVDFVTPRLMGVADRNEAEKVIQKNRFQLENRIKQVLSETGRDYGLQTRIGVFEFPACSYGELFLPAGRYRAVEIILGDGKGQNWWCVLYPPLCLPVVMEGRVDDADLKTAGATEDWRRSIRFKIKLVELFEKIAN